MSSRRLVSAVALLAVLGGCSDVTAPQFPRKTEFRSQHYTQMPDAQWCAKASADGWTPPECAR